MTLEILLFLVLLPVVFLIGVRLGIRFTYPDQPTSAAVVAIVGEATEKHGGFSRTYRNMEFLKSVTGKSLSDIERALFILCESKVIEETLVDGVVTYKILVVPEQSKSIPAVPNEKPFWMNFCSGSSSKTYYLVNTDSRGNTRFYLKHERG